MQVEKSDVMEAFRLLEVAMQQSATDHSTGSYSVALKNTKIPLPDYVTLSKINLNDVFLQNISFKEPLTWILSLREFRLVKG